MSRRPKAKAGNLKPGHQYLFPGDALCPNAVDFCLGRADDPGLVWNVSLEEILQAVQTVGGIAHLARVDRKTVYRLEIPPNTCTALCFVRDRRLQIGVPLVMKSDPSKLSSQTTSQQFFRLILWIRGVRIEGFGRKICVRDATLKSRNNLRRRNEHVYDESREMNDEDRKRFRRVFYYRPPGRVTVQQICSAFGFSRVWFWKWRKNLPLAQRKQLKLEMNWKPLANSSPFNADTVTKEAFEEFDYDTIEKRLANG